MHAIKTIQIMVLCFGLASAQNGSPTQDGDTVRAVFEMLGVNGTIVFGPGNGENTTTATFDLMMDGGPYTWEVRSLPVIFSRPAASRCSDDSLGPRIFDLSIDSNEAQITAGTTTATIMLPLYDVANTALVGHSLLLTSGESRVCASIQSLGVPLVQAALPAPVSGTIQVRKHRSNYFSIITDLIESAGSVSKPGAVDVQILQGSVTLDLPGFTGTPNMKQRCENITGSQQSIYTIRSVPIALSGTVHRAIYFTSDLESLFSGDTGHYILTGEVLGRTNCANLNKIFMRRVETAFNEKGVHGTITFAQNSIYEATLVQVNLAGLSGNGTGYHVHMYPVGYKYINVDDKRCTRTGGHYAPIGGSTSGTQDMFEIGDLSGKHGLLTNQNEVNEDYIDWNLPLFGPYSVVGRSIVIHTASSRWLCSNIGYPGETIVAQARFGSFAHGTIIMKQQVGQPEGETTVYLNMQQAGFTAAATNDHNYHVHQTAVGDDYNADSSRCSSTGGHYNPYAVDLSASNYSSDCRANERRCEVGDLSNKFGPLDLAAGNAEVGTQAMFTAVSLPLSGAYSIVGRSITIHDEDRTGPRYACADIVQLLSVSTRLANWGGPLQLNQNDIKFAETSAQYLSLTTLDLNNVETLGGYHVHQKPLNSTADSVCGSTGGHYNPFKASNPGSSATYDEYEIGDLSGKYISLAGQDKVNTNFTDTNLPLRGANAVVGRSVVFHAEAGGARQMCADVMFDEKAMGGSLVQAKATFEGEVEGEILFSQVTNGNVAQTGVVINVNLRNGDGHPTTQNHNWHVHVQPVSPNELGKCSSTLGHYNPFNVDVGSDDYKNLCSSSNPYRCEVGDLSNKHAQISLDSSSAMVFNDEFLSLVGRQSIVGRSIVIHQAEGGAPRHACATIVPAISDPRKSYSLYVDKPQDTTNAMQEMKERIAAELKVDDRYVAVKADEQVGQCYKVTVYFTGDKAEELMKELEFSSLDSKFQSRSAHDCGEPSGATQMVLSAFLFITTSLTKIVLF